MGTLVVARADGAGARRHPYQPIGDPDLRVEAWQLLAQGTGGRSLITKRPRPFDAEVMRSQVMESMIHPNKPR
jgi:hypothetical protein